MFFPWDIFCSQLSLVWALKGHLLHGGPSRLQGTNVFNCLFYHNNRNYSRYLLVTTTKLKESNNKNRSKHNLKKKLQFFSCSQADVMFFFSPRSFPVVSSFLPACVQSCSNTVCYVSLWTLPVLPWFVLCAFLAVKMLTPSALQLPEGAEGSTLSARSGRYPLGCFLSSFEEHTAVRLCVFKDDKASWGV